MRQWKIYMFTHSNKITLQINAKMSCCALLKYVIMLPVQERGNRAVGKEKGTEKRSTLPFWIERGKSHTGLCKHILQSKTNSNTPEIKFWDCSLQIWNMQWCEFLWYYTNIPPKSLSKSFVYQVYCFKRKNIRANNLRSEFRKQKLIASTQDLTQELVS